MVEQDVFPGTFPVWSPDGRELFFIQGKEHRRASLAGRRFHDPDSFPCVPGLDDGLDTHGTEASHRSRRALLASLQSVPLRRFPRRDLGRLTPSQRRRRFRRAHRIPSYGPTSLCRAYGTHDQPPRARLSANGKRIRVASHLSGRPESSLFRAGRYLDRRPGRQRIRAPALQPPRLRHASLVVPRGRPARLRVGPRRRL
jgi:hypothetical protein